MVFNWSLNDSKSPAVFMTFLSILAVLKMLLFGWNIIVTYCEFITGANPLVDWLVL